MTTGMAASDANPCLTCGACCHYSKTWPRFTMETDAEIALIPEALVDARGARMRCEDNRCSALQGKIGETVACTIYAIRPIVCRDCEIGDDACQMARARHGMPPIVL
jgi:uncharacterized protein